MVLGCRWCVVSVSVVGLVSLVPGIGLGRVFCCRGLRGGDQSLLILNLCCCQSLVLKYSFSLIFLSYLWKSLIIMFFLWYVVDGTNVRPRLRTVISSSVRWCVDLLTMYFFLAAIFLLCVLPGL